MRHSIALVLVCFHFAWSQGIKGIDPAFVKMYNEKVCHNEPSCNLIDTPGLLPSKLTFEGRDCMCDSECVEYNDCCKDSSYYKATPSTISEQKYRCSPESRVYMVANCPSTYANAEIKENCEKANLTLKQNMVEIIVPVTDRNQNKTYANIYCARCNGVIHSESWLSDARCAELSLECRNSISASSSLNNTVENKIAVSSTPRTTTPESNKFITLYVFFNRVPLFGGSNSADDNFYKKVKIPIPIFGIDKGNNDNMILGSTVRNKRNSKCDYDFYKYASKAKEIIKNATFDSNLARFVAKHDGKDFICEYRTKLPDNYDNYVRKCVPNLISRCPMDDETNKLCQSYTSVVYDKTNKTAYRNKDCARCNGESLDRITGCPLIVREDGFSGVNEGHMAMDCSKPGADSFC